MMPDTDIIDRLFLELSQFTNATTRKEIDLQAERALLKQRIAELEKISKGKDEQIDAMNNLAVDDLS